MGNEKQFNGFLQKPSGRMCHCIECQPDLPDGPSVLDHIERHITLDQKTNQIVFKATSAFDAEIMLHVDLNDELILSVEGPNQESQSWILDKG